MTRVAGADESYALAQRLFGWTAPIQYLWVFSRDPGDEAIDELARELAAGSFDRKIVHAAVPVARDRWVRSGRQPSVRREPELLPDEGVGTWVDTRLRSADLDPASGRGWTIDWARTESGRTVVSLLVSHMVADGQAVYAALAAAASRTSRSNLSDEREATGPRAVLGDLSDAAAQVPAVATAVAVIARSAVSAALRSLRRGPSGDDETATTVWVNPVPPKSERTDEPDTTLAVVDLDRAEWHARATELGGTPNGLFTALLASILRRTGYPVAADGTRICIAVSTRGDDDERANASGGVWIRVPGPISPDHGLQEIRRLSKAAFARYASSDESVADHLQSVARLLPDRILGRMMTSIAGPDTTVSNLGVAPDSALQLGGEVAESFAIRAIMQGREAEDRRHQGPAIAAWAVEYADKVTITFFGIHPDYAGDEAELRSTIDAELTEWSLAHTFW